eukprot:gnl/TRDRNA2_/TRDRNA2_185297_c0_seq1.p1 gnl/TRDRNA2_/TRDRNA2_185297_c0~~gnl/TRDRNA2_/TRDRNA2_185297_c0_seq1.p1  ORF type:complete len:292 (+),score=39.81 gnl/TRDRNA2_/TRDRNA2_185297_c0_seq1:108-983(+)
MPLDGEAPPNEEDKDHDNDDERDPICTSHHICAISFCLLICVGCGVVMIWLGPENVLRWGLRLVPKDPGWDWYIGMGLVTSVSIVMLLPIWPPMCMAAGLFFGLWWGSLLNFFSIVLAAVVSFLIGRCILKEPIRNCIERGDYPTARRTMLILEDEEESIKFLILFRFLFIPMFIRNYGPSTLEIPFWKLFVSCLPHSIWISILFASLGATFKDTAELVRDGKEISWDHVRWQQFIIFVVSIIVAIILAIYAQYKYNQKLEEEEKKTMAQEEGTAGSVTSTTASAREIKSR